MADGHPTRAAEVLGDHAYKGGYDLSDVYGKKKPSSSSSSGGAYVSSVEDSSAGPYGGPQYVAPYAKPAAKPTNTTEDYSESRPPVASSGHGKYDNYGESRPPGYAEGQHSSHPGYGRRPDSGLPAAASGQGTFDNYGQSGYVEEGQYSSHPGYEGRPDSRPPAASSGHGKHDNYGKERPSQYVEGQYSSRPGYVGETPEEQFGGAPDQDYGRKPNYGGEYETEGKYPPSGHRKNDNYGGSRPSKYVEEGQYLSRPGYVGEYEIPEGQCGGGPDQGYGRKPNYGGEYETEGKYTPSVGYGGRRPAAPYREEELPSWLSAPPQSQHSGSIDESECCEGRISGPRRPGWQQHPQDTGFGGQGGGGTRPPHGRPESGFTEYEAPRPTYEGHQGSGGYGSIPFKHENRHEQEEYHTKLPERFGRHNDGDWLAYETAGLSLGSGGHAGRDEGCRSKRDDSDSDDEKKKHNKHHEKHGHHHQKHGDDYS